MIIGFKIHTLVDFCPERTLYACLPLSKAGNATIIIIIIWYTMDRYAKLRGGAHADSLFRPTTFTYSIQALHVHGQILIKGQNINDS